MMLSHNGTKLQKKTPRSGRDNMAAESDEARPGMSEASASSTHDKPRASSSSTFTRPASSKKSRGICGMRSSLRRKFGKHKAGPDVKTAKSADDDTSSTGRSSNDSELEAAINQAQRRSAQRDYRSVPPPSQKQLSAPISPVSRAALVRLRNLETLRQKNIEASTMQAAMESELRNASEESITANEHSRKNRSPDLPKSAVKAPAAQNDVPRETKRVNGVEFEMMRKNASSSSSTVSRDNGNASSVRESRQTRSQTRREEVSNSQNGLLQPPTSNHVQGHTIRKVRDTDRTPSPRTNEDEDEITPAGPDPLTTAPKKTDHQEAAARPLPLTPSSEGGSSTPSRLPTSPGSNIARPKLSSYRRSQRKKFQVDTSAEPIAEPTPVIPPMFSSRIPPTHVWTSALSSTSRPREPWHWPKRWTCCQCADLDPSGGDQPAQTIVEQKICSRLECGHERCRQGCRI